jgi:cyanobactin maturation PatA/PatG family protease
MMSKFAAMLPGLSELWAESAGDPEICVAVLDGPVDVLHPCFRGARLDRLETLISQEAGPGAMSAHGTHVASLIFGQPGSSVRGIAPRCRGLIVPVFRDYQEGHLSQLDLARAIEQAVQGGAHIINISGGERSPRGQADDVLAHAVRLCERSNVLLIAAVGNDGCECLHVPAALSGVLAVGALGATGRPLDISNWGEAYRTNGILAPGQNIPGAVPGGGIATFTGSSFATPIISRRGSIAAEHSTPERR